MAMAMDSRTFWTQPHGLALTHLAITLETLYQGLVANDFIYVMNESAFIILLALSLYCYKDNTANCN
jgi:hypothetical protein